MNHVERFRAVMAFEPFDRMPRIEWAGYWDRTLERWRAEGLPAEPTDAGEIRESFGLDCYRQWWIEPTNRDCPPVEDYAKLYAGKVRDRREYEVWRERYLFPEETVDVEAVREWEKKHTAGEMVAWITLNGFFWFPRVLLGVEAHMYAFYDAPELIHEMNEDLLRFSLRVLDQFCAVFTPEFMTFAEDMSYNHGPMLSKACFDEFLAPYYRQIVPEIRRRGIVPFVDSDGDVSKLIPWLEEVGVEGILPLERMAGVDVGALRRRHPRLKMIGAFDKTVMHRGEAAMRQEFERLLPVMKTGGFIPSVDHQTPPAVSLEDYRLYISLLKEYCGEAAAS